MIVAVKTDLYFSSIRHLTQQSYTQVKRLRSSQKIVLDSIRQTDPEKADAIKKHLADAEQVIAQMRSGQSKAAQTRKAEAAEKIKRIKEEIKMLMAMGGDPKMVARQIARLAKDLAAAAREYVSAVAALSKDNAALAETEVSISGNNNMSAEAQSDSTAGGASASPSLSAFPVPFGEKRENDGRASLDASLTASADVVQYKSMRQYQDALRQQMKVDLQNKAAEVSSKNSAAEADRQFSREVCTLAALLKLLSRQQKERLLQVGDRTADYEIIQSRQALAEVEKSIPGLSTTGIIA